MTGDHAHRRAQRRMGLWEGNIPISSQILSFKIYHHLESTTYANSTNSGCHPNDHDLRGKVGELTPFASFFTAWRDGLRSLTDSAFPHRFAKAHPPVTDNLDL